MSYALVNIINLVFQALSVLILIDVLASWLVAARVRLPDWGYDILRAIHNVTGIVLNPIRRVIPSVGGLDFSPIIALILLDVVRRLLISALV